LDRGSVRAENQDAIFIPAPDVHHKKQVFILADGMGGAKAGGLASQLAVKTIAETFSSRPKKVNLETCLLEAFHDAALTIHRYAQDNPETSGMGTTVVAVAFEANHAMVANVGDSRCYLWEAKRLRQITHDHSLVQEMLDQGNLSTEEAKRHKYRNVLTRVVGNSSDVEPDIFSLELSQGNLLLLCSDGLHGVLDDREIAEVLSGEADLQSQADRLVALANQNGGPDNISVVLLKVGETDSELAEEAGLLAVISASPFVEKLWSSRMVAGGVGLAIVALLACALFWLWSGPDDDQAVSRAAPKVVSTQDAPLDQVKTVEQPSPNSLPATQPDQAATTGEPQKPKMIGTTSQDAPKAKLIDAELAPGPEKKGNQPEREIASASVGVEQKFENLLRTHLYDGKARIFYQLGAYGSCEGLRRAMSELTDKFPDPSEARPVWTLTTAGRGARLLFKLYLQAPTGKKAEAAVTLLSGFKPLPAQKRPKPLPLGSAFTFKRKSMSRLDSAKVEDTSLAMVLLAGPKMSVQQAALAGEIVNAGLKGALVVFDAGAGPKATTQMAEAAGKMAGNHPVFLYRGGRVKKRDELVCAKSQLPGFLLAVAKVCPKLSLLPPVSASPSLKMVDR